MDPITFQSPAFLGFLALLPLLVALHVYSLQFARSRAVRFANMEALQRLMQSTNVVPDNYPLLALRVLALVGFTLAAAGITLHYTSPSPSYDFVLAVQTSNSMLARDVAPTRLSAATDGLATWASALPSGAHVGLVTFSSQATVLAPLSDDMPALSRTVRSISSFSGGGTALCEALRASVNQLLTSPNPRAVILLADGQTNAGCKLSEGIAYAQANNVTVFSIGAGTLEGGTIEGLPEDVVFSLNDTDLRRAALETGGNYSQMSSPADLQAALASVSHSVDMPQSMPLATSMMLFAFFLVFIDWGLSGTRYRAGP